MLIFDKDKFISFVNNKEILPDSYTSFKNKIGLMDNGNYLKEKGDVVLAWAYKDCVLEGGQLITIVMTPGTPGGTPAKHLMLKCNAADVATGSSFRLIGADGKVLEKGEELKGILERLVAMREEDEGTDLYVGLRFGDDFPILAEVNQVERMDAV